MREKCRREGGYQLSVMCEHSILIECSNTTLSWYLWDLVLMVLALFILVVCYLS